jgi:uncharacterized protein (TIGR01777 family)
MTTFRSQVTVHHPIDEVFAWHERPGALIRLCPPWNGSVAAAPSNGLAVGSKATLRLDVPGTFGLLGLPWVAEHVALDPGRSFTDVMASGPLRSWRHRHDFASADDGRATTITDTIEFRGPVPGLDRLQGPIIRKVLVDDFAYRERQLVDDLAFHAAHGGARRVVAVAGASGLIGSQLCALLSTGGHEVRRLVRRPAQAPDEISWDPGSGSLDADDLADVDIVVHLGGRTIGGRFTPANKREMRRSRIDSTNLLAGAVAQLAERGRAISFVCGSAIGYYGADRGDERLDESSRSGDDFLAELCRDWEHATEPAREAGARVVNVRTGIVQSPAGGALARQLPLFRAGLGGRLGNGKQWVSWISIDDIVGAFAHAALTDDLVGAINAVAPEPVRGGRYAEVLGSVLHRPAVLPVPSFGPALLLGREGAEEIVRASQRVAAGALIATGYEFRQPTLDAALRHVLGR